MKIYTIGFTRKTARRFFHLLHEAGVKKVIDTRLHNTSQLSGFAKQDDLSFFLRALEGIDYVHEPLLAPTDSMLGDYKKRRLTWPEYESQYVRLLQDRAIESRLSRESLTEGCLLCSEDKPHRCHRRLAAEYLKEQWGGIEICHLI